jgi:hypothetical protein
MSLSVTRNKHMGNSAKIGSNSVFTVLWSRKSYYKYVFHLFIVILLELDEIYSEHHGLLYFRWRYQVDFHAERSKKRKNHVSAPKVLFFKLLHFFRFHFVLIFSFYFKQQLYQTFISKHFFLCQTI